MDEDAGLAYIAAGLPERAIEAYCAAGQWRMALALAGERLMPKNCFSCTCIKRAVEAYCAAGQWRMGVVLASEQLAVVQFIPFFFACLSWASKGAALLGSGARCWRWQVWCSSG